MGILERIKVGFVIRYGGYKAFDKSRCLPFYWLEGRDGKGSRVFKSSVMKDIGSMYDSDNVTV